MFTLFHVLVLAGLGLGVAIGARVGSRHFGIAGGVGGAIVGAIVGIIVARIPELLALRSVARRLTPKTPAELRQYLRSPECLTPNCVLLELRRRGEDIRCELPVVVDLLVSADVGRRGFGWAALNSAFPELVSQIPDYRIGDPIEECRRNTEVLTRMAKSSNQ